jgi:phage I-like protein
MSGDETVLLCAQPLDASQGAPEWVMLFPAGQVRGRSGREFVLTPAAARLAADAFAENGADLPVDLEHATQLKGAKGEPAPAVGWITAIDVRDGALWGRVDWTDDGRRMIEARAYRYLSPAFVITRAARAVVRLLGAGLTNQPDLRMPALARTDTIEPLDREPQELQEAELTAISTELAQALGLDADAAEADALAAIAALQAERDTALARTPDLEAYVPRAEFDQALARLQAFETDAQARHEAEIEAAVAQAVAEGKIMPAVRDDYVAFCRQEGGLARFRAIVARMPVIAAPSGPAAAAPQPAQGSLTEGEIAIARAMDVPVDRVAAHKKQQAE